ncbi:hypothetical protein Q3G72_002476 [Acer saccharum]|nr:hypothetical protein Q3G72_002476 [Acer saccharum]
MDRNWIWSRNRLSKEYRDGIQSFTDVARNYLDQDNKTLCPCRDCLNTSSHNISTLKAHLREYRFSRSYDTWIFHGEQIDHNNEERNDLGHGVDEDDYVDDYVGMLNDAIGLMDMNVDMGVGESTNEIIDSNNDFPDIEGDKFNDLFSAAMQELYAGCTKFSVMSFILKLIHIKVLNHWSNKSFDMLLQFFKDFLSEGSNIPMSHYNAKKMLRDLGLGYESTHACKHDCTLFWKEHARADKCPVCNESRYEIDDGKGWWWLSGVWVATAGCCIVSRSCGFSLFLIGFCLVFLWLFVAAWVVGEPGLCFSFVCFAPSCPLWPL